MKKAEEQASKEAAENIRKEAQEKARQSLEEQTKLVGEKNQLLQTVKKLNRDVAKLENFKRSLLQQLQDDDEVRKGVLYALPSIPNERHVDIVVVVVVLEALIHKCLSFISNALTLFSAPPVH